VFGYEDLIGDFVSTSNARQSTREQESQENQSEAEDKCCLIKEVKELSEETKAINASGSFAGRPHKGTGKNTKH
tara:strand:- start:55 stop:276 length:222 start_codon:yes stop_codon:yes gene_type:complete